MKSRYLIFILFTWSHFAANAQLEQRINFSLGIGQTATQDLTTSRFVSRGLMLPVKLEYETNKAKSQEYTSIGFTSGNVSSSTDFNSSLRQINLSTGYNHHVFHFSKWQASLGGEWNNAFIIRNTTSINQNRSVSFFSALRVTARGVVNLPHEQQLQFFVKLPLLAYTVRPGYALSIPVEESSLSQFLQSGNWAGVNQFKYTNISVQYTKNFTRTMSVRWVYTFSWVNFNDPMHSQRMTLVNNELAFTLSYWLNHPK